MESSVLTTLCICWPVSGAAAACTLTHSAVLGMQTRSLASQTARQTEASGKPALTWFAADFKEELSAFDGQLLVRPCHCEHCSPVFMLAQAISLHLCAFGASDPHLNLHLIPSGSLIACITCMTDAASDLHQTALHDCSRNN